VHSSWGPLLCNCQPVWSSSKLCIGLSFSKLHLVSKDGEPGAAGEI